MGSWARSVFSAFFVGTMFGTLPPLVECVHRRSPLTTHAVAGFALLLGGSSVGAEILAHALRWRAPRLVSAGLVSALLAAALLLFYVNVVMLPDVGILHPRSLAWSLAVVLLILAPLALLAVKSRGIEPGPTGWAWSALGALALSSSLAGVAGSWPKSATALNATGQGPDLAVIALDAVRRDHLGLYGYLQPTSPALDALGSKARVFERAFAASSWTRYAVPAILGIELRRRGRISLVEDLKGRGYSTACFSDNPLLEEGSSLSRGFHYVGVSYGPLLRFGQRIFDGTFVGEFILRWPILAYLWDDARLVARARAWIESVQGPIFVYVHLMDAHMPYKRSGIDGRGWRQRQIETPRPGVKVSGVEREDIISHYDGGIRTADAALGQLVEVLRRRGRPLLIILTADHGESLGDEDRWGHGHDLGPDVLGVPLIAVGDGVVPGRVRAPVGHSSIGMTLLIAAGEPCADCVGNDLRTSDGGADALRRPAAAASLPRGVWPQADPEPSDR